MYYVVFMAFLQYTVMKLVTFKQVISQQTFNFYGPLRSQYFSGIEVETFCMQIMTVNMLSRPKHIYMEVS